MLQLITSKGSIPIISFICIITATHSKLCLIFYFIFVRVFFSLMWEKYDEQLTKYSKKNMCCHTICITLSLSSRGSSKLYFFISFISFLYPGFHVHCMLYIDSNIEDNASFKFGGTGRFFCFCFCV